MNMKSILVGLALLAIVTLAGCVMPPPPPPSVTYYPSPAPVIVDYGYYPLPFCVAPLIWPYGYYRPYHYGHWHR